ncbi:MAG: hypothetical protein P8J37_05135 [Fuerstiella sp.]|nr:hypothetical protein [Fuerstiella sp.]
MSLPLGCEVVTAEMIGGISIQAAGNVPIHSQTTHRNILSIQWPGSVTWDRSLATEAYWQFDPEPHVSV